MEESAAPVAPARERCRIRERAGLSTLDAKTDALVRIAALVASNAVAAVVPVRDP